MKNSAQLLTLTRRPIWIKKTILNEYFKGKFWENSEHKNAKKLRRVREMLYVVRGNINGASTHN